MNESWETLFAERHFFPGKNRIRKGISTICFALLDIPHRRTSKVKNDQ